MIAAVFTCRLGVAGTLIGMELTAVVITLSSAIFKAQLMKASHHLRSLPKMVRGRPPYSRFTSPAKRTRNRTHSRPRQTRPWLALPLARHARLPQRVTVPQEAQGTPRWSARRAGRYGDRTGHCHRLELIGGKTLSSMIWSCRERIPARKSHPVARVSPS